MCCYTRKSNVAKKLMADGSLQLVQRPESVEQLNAIVEFDLSCTLRLCGEALTLASSNIINGPAEIIAYVTFATEKSSEAADLSFVHSLQLDELIQFMIDCKHGIELRLNEAREEVNRLEVDMEEKANEMRRLDEVFT